MYACSMSDGFAVFPSRPLDTTHSGVLEEVSVNICMLKDLESLPYGFYTGRCVTWTHRDGDTSMRIEGTEME